MRIALNGRGKEYRIKFINFKDDKPTIPQFYMIVIFYVLLGQ